MMMKDKKTIRVNPGRAKSGGDLVIYDDRHRLIKRTKEGTRAANNAFMRRRLKDKDMVLVIKGKDVTLEKYKADADAKAKADADAKAKADAKASAKGGN